MVKTRFFLLLSLLLVLLAACAPASTATSPPAAPTALLPTQTAGPGLDPATEPAAATEAMEATPLPVATSRGPELHATDPTTVSLASGGLHFVEFFRFT